MPKLQEVKRANGSNVFSVNIPLDMMQCSGWKKGDELHIEAIAGSDGSFRLIITREEDTHGEIRSVPGQEEGMEISS